jgi:hypothetical protein
MVKPKVSTLQPRMTTITGLLRIASIQSKFSNIVLAPFGFWPFAGGDPAD